MPTPRRLAACLTMFLAAVRLVHAENWPGWRGQGGQGISGEAGIVTEWGPGVNEAWSAAIPGEGHSSPIVWEDAVFLTAALGKGHERALHRIDAATGKIVWITVVAVSKELEPQHAENDYASSTPATDGKAVYTSFQANGKVHLAATDFDGKKRWELEPMPAETEHGYCYTPLLAEGRLILSIDQLAHSAVIGVDTATGKIAWRIEGNNISCSNVPPALANAGGRNLAVQYGSDIVRALEPGTGEVVWWSRGPTDYCVATPVAGDGLVFVNGGYPVKRGLALRVEGRGEITATGLAWEIKKGIPYVPSPVFHEGAFFVVTDGGVSYALDSKTGETLWQERLPGRYRCSPTLIEGRIFIVNEEGEGTVFKASREKLEKTGGGKLEGLFYASPAVSGGRLFLRSRERLWAFAKGVGDSGGR